MENQIDQIFALHAEGLTAGKIAQKMKIKKSEVELILGDAAKPAGLGDYVEKFTEATGIKKVVEALVDDCGCAARKEALNKLFPTRKLNDLSLEDYAYLESFYSSDPKSVTSPQQKELVRIYNSVFNAKREVSNCSPCIASMVTELKRIYVEASKKH